MSGEEELAVTSPPTGARESPTRPVIGERTVPYSRFNVAFVSAARCCCSLPFGRLYLRIGTEPGLLDVSFVRPNVRLGGTQIRSRGIQVLPGGRILLRQAASSG